MLEANGQTRLAAPIPSHKRNTSDTVMTKSPGRDVIIERSSENNSDGSHVTHVS